MNIFYDDIRKIVVDLLTDMKSKLVKVIFNINWQIVRVSFNLLINKPLKFVDNKHFFHTDIDV